MQITVFMKPIIIYDNTRLNKDITSKKIRRVMDIALDCIPCIINNYIKLIENNLLSDEIKEESLREFFAFLAKLL